MSAKRKGILIAVCIIAAFIIAAVVIAPRVFQVDRYRPEVVSLIEQKTGRKVTMSRLGLSVFPFIQITADNLAVSNPPGFPQGNWLTVKRVKARLDAGALLHRRIVVRSLDLSQPVVMLLKNPNGRWNYEPPSEAGKAPGSTAASAGRGGLDDPLDGGRSAKAGNRSANGGIPDYAEAALASFVVSQPAAADQDPDTPLFSLQEISGVTIAGGRLTVSTILPGGAVAPATLVADGIQAELKNVDVASVGVASPLPAGASGKVSVKALHSNGLAGTNFTSPIKVLAKQIDLPDLKFDFYGGKGAADIMLNLSGAALSYSAQGSLSGVNVADLLKQFPSMSGQLTGTAASHFTLSGPAAGSSDSADGLHGGGTLTVSNGRFPHLRLDKTLLDLAHVAQIKAASGDPSSFSSIDIDWKLNGPSLSTPRVHVNGNGLVVDGSGTIDLNPPERLVYQGVAHLAAATNPLTNLLADVSGVSFRNGELILPFTVTGTASRPVFRLKQNAREQLLNPLAKPGQAPQAIQNILKLFQKKR